MDKAKLVGVNHVVLEVGDLEQALDWWRQLFDFEMRGQGDGHAFLDMGDQFIGLMEGDGSGRDAERHFGLVVNDRAAVEAAASAAGVERLDNRFLDLVDPWGNRIQIIQYDAIQFTKTDAVLRAMGVSATKTEDAKRELRDKGMLD